MQCFFGIRRPARGAGQGLTALHMTKNFRNQRRILDGGDDPELAAAFRAGFDVDGEYPPEALRPAHRRHWLVSIHFAPPAPWHDPSPVLEVRGEHPMETREIEFGARDQRSESCHEIQRLQDDVG